MSLSLKIFLAALCLFSGAHYQTFANTGEGPCIAYNVQDINYVSFMNYQVICPQESFATEKNVITFLLPLPYRWRQVAYNRLEKEMDSRGLVEFMEMDAGFREESLLIFDDPSNSVDEYCLVVQRNPRQTGITQTKTTYDFILNCQKMGDAGSHSRDFFYGIEQEELKEYMQDYGFEFRLSGGANGILMIPSLSRPYSAVTKLLLFVK